MSDLHHPPRGRHPVEPEILPPQHERSGVNGIWLRVEERDGVRRVTFTRPSTTAVLLSLLIVGVGVAVSLIILTGLVLLWVPFLLAVIAAVVLSGSLRRWWARLRHWAGW